MSAAVDGARFARWDARQMVVADLDEVVRVEQQIYPFAWTRGNFDDSLRSGYDAWVFDGDDGLIGYAVVMWVPQEVHLLNLSVRADRQGRGYGRAFLDWLCGDARVRGALSMLLEVRPSNLPARTLYDTSGFRLLGVRKRYYPSANQTREDALVMLKRLAP